MKLRMINATSLIIKFEKECRTLYSFLREKELFITDDYLLVFKEVEYLEDTK